MSRLYDAKRWKTFAEFRAFLETTPNPVVLLEGTRQLTESEAAPLVALGRKLATELPNVVVCINAPIGKAKEHRR